MANIALGALGFIPSLLITPVNLDRFGLIGGSALSLSGEILGALCGFWLYRYGAKRIPPAWQQHRWFQYFQHQQVKTVFWSVLVLRLVPFVPSGVVTAGAAVTRISAPAFFVASSIGKLPAVALEIAVAFGLTMLLPRSVLYSVLGLGLLVTAVTVLYRRRSTPPSNQESI
ncbi:VTT domain-containing protein [Planococcus sp. ISL-109]|nr:VTT domain-containing protein [Planococcus sp. ISL-109]